MNRNRRELLLKIGLLITLLLCTAARGYEILVTQKAHGSYSKMLNGAVITQDGGPIYYRVTTTMEKTTPVRSNVCGVLMDEKGQAYASRNFGYGEFELIQQAAANMNSKELAQLESIIFHSSDEEYAAIIKKLANGSHDQYVLAARKDGEG